jgi:hypothetical protein
MAASSSPHASRAAPSSGCSILGDVVGENPVPAFNSEDFAGFVEITEGFFQVQAGMEREYLIRRQNALAVQGSQDGCLGWLRPTDPL